MLIKEWVDEINRQLPTTHQILTKFKRDGLMSDISEAREYLKEITLIYMERENTKNNPLNELIGGTNVGSVRIGGIDFFESIQKNSVFEGYFDFARYNDFYTLSFKDKTVYIFDDESDNVELVTDSCEEFLEFISECNKIYMNSIFDVEYDKDYSSIIIKKLINNKFSKKLLYEFIH